MNRIRRFGILVTLLALPAITASAQNAPVTAETNGISLSILINGANAEITVSAEAKGWVAVGFDPTSMMKGAGIFIGYVKDGTAYARDDFGTGFTSHGPDENLGGKNSIISFMGKEKDGRTTMTFVVPVDSGDPNDAKLSPGKHSVILAASNSDSFTGFHVKKGKTVITFP